MLPKSWAKKEKKSGSTAGADDEGAAEEEAEKAGEGSTWAHSHRGLHHSHQMLGWNKVEVVVYEYLWPFII